MSMLDYSLEQDFQLSDGIISRTNCIQCANSEGSGETAQMHSLAWTFTVPSYMKHPLTVSPRIIIIIFVVFVVVLSLPSVFSTRDDSSYRQPPEIDNEIVNLSILYFYRKSSYCWNWQGDSITVKKSGFG